MAGFRKAKAEQAALKIGLYGPAGSGKTCTALLIAEGLKNRYGKEIAYVDTERGTDFYAVPNPARKWHPDPFEFDALYSKSLTEIDEQIRKLSPKTYGVVIIDSMTHLWEAARAAYSGPTGPGGQIPIAAWGRIKAPYKRLVDFLLSSPLHVIMCGRQGNEFDEDDQGKMVKVGVKMKAEGETPYEPHILLRITAEKADDGTSVPTVYVEKDRTSTLFGRVIQWPNFENIALPILPLLGDKQAVIQSDQAAATQDAAALAEAEAEKARRAEELRGLFLSQISQAKSWEALDEIGKRITPEVKEVMGPAVVAEVRAAFVERSDQYPKPQK